MTFRDDDINLTTDLERFKKIDKLFKNYKVDHTIAVLTKDIAQHKELIKYIKDNPHIKPQLHGWTHIDYTKENGNPKYQLERGSQEFEEVFGFKPTVFYPPWNKSDATVEQYANDLGMKVSWQKISLSQYVRVQGTVEENIINFHYWADSDTMFLEPALRIYGQVR